MQRLGTGQNPRPIKKLGRGERDARTGPVVEDLRSTLGRPRFEKINPQPTRAANDVRRFDSQWRSEATAASAIAWLGSAVTNQASWPNAASETATFASPPA